MHEFVYIGNDVTERLILHSQLVSVLDHVFPSFHSDLFIVRITTVDTASIMNNMSGIVDSFWSRSLLEVCVVG